MIVFICLASGCVEVLLLVGAGDLVAALGQKGAQPLDRGRFFGVRTQVQDVGHRAVLPRLEGDRHAGHRLGQVVGLDVVGHGDAPQAHPLLAGRVER